MPGLTEEQVNGLLAGPVLARFATVTPDGAPYVVPVWQHWEGGAMYIVPRRLSRFVEHLRFEPRVAVSCSDDSKGTRVLIEGAAEVLEGPTSMSGRMLEIARAMALRYSGKPGLDYIEATIDKPRYLVRIIPTQMTTWTGGWHPRYG